MSAVPEPGVPTRVGPGADGSPRRLVIRSFPYRHWLLAAFLLFLAGFMFFRIVRGTVEDIIVEIANTGWWQYAAAGLLCSIALAVAAQGEVEDSFVLTTWSIRSGRQRVRRFAMSDIASIKPCILQRNTEHKHYKVIVAFADSTRVFLLDTRSRQVVVDNVRRIRLHVFNDSTTASRRVARRRRRRQEHTISSAAVAGEVGDGDGGSPSCHAVRPPDGPTRDHTRGHGKRREKERSGKVHAGPMRKERRRERKGRKSHAVGSPLSDGGKDFSLDTAEAGAGAGSWKGGTLAHSPPRGRSGDVETGHTAAAGFAPPVTTTAAAGAAVPPSPTQVP